MNEFNEFIKRLERILERQKWEMRSIPAAKNFLDKIEEADE